MYERFARDIMSSARELSQRGMSLLDIKLGYKPVGMNDSIILQIYDEKSGEVLGSVGYSGVEVEKDKTDGFHHYFLEKGDRFDYFLSSNTSLSLKIKRYTSAAHYSYKKRGREQEKTKQEKRPV